MNKVIGKIATAITCLMVAAVCCFPTWTHFVGAEEVHAHDYTNGRCTCGSALFEAETADLTGSSPSPGNDTNISKNDAASGGGLVNNWSVTGNEIVWTFSIDKQATAPIELVMSPCEDATTFSTTLSLTVNGAAVEMADDNIRGIVGEQWHNYSAFTTKPVAFAKGDVRIVLKAKRAYNVNIDCLRVNFAAAEDVAVGAFNKMSTNEHTHIFADGACDCGALLYEAEDGNIVGTPTGDNRDHSAFFGTNQAAHGGRNICQFGSGDNILTWTLNNRDTAMTGARIDLVFASCTGSATHSLPTAAGGNTAAWPFELRTEHAGNVKTTVLWQSGAVAPMPEENYHDYRVYSTKPFDLVAGENKIALESYNGFPMNIDYMVFYPASEEPDEPVDPAHTHSYTDGRCTCGSALFEAETADLSGSRPSDPNEADCVGANSAASGGGLVDNWSVTGNEIVWTFSIDKQATAPIELVMSPCEDATTFSTTLSLTVNGAAVEMADDNIRGIVGEQWHNYSAFTTKPVAFAKGNVKIVLKAKRAYNVNIDCLRVNFAAADTVAVGAFEYRFEAEDGAVTGTSSDPNGDPMVAERPESSGGGLVKNFATAGNKITWKFNLNKAYDNIAAEIFIAPCGDSVQPVSSIGLTVNGTSAAFTETEIPARVGDAWHDYRPFHVTGVNLTKNNVVVFENVGGINMNIDYLLLGLPSDAVVSEYTDPTPVEPEHTHAFTKGVCTVCGAAKLEAEDGSPVGTPANGNESFFEETEAASGGWDIGNWGEGDNILTFAFEADKACENVTIEFVFAPCTNGSAYTLPRTTEEAVWDNKGASLWPFLLRANGVGQGFTASDVPSYAGDENWHNWHTVKTNPVSLNQGPNTVEIEACDLYSMNLDYIVLDVPDDVTITMNVLDQIPPTISTITVEPSDPKAGSEVSFSFTLSDNISAADKITVDVHVYMNYGKPVQSEIPCSGNKFTPPEAGRYTIVIDATDEAELSAQKVRLITVSAADTTDPTPPGGEDPDPGVTDLEEGGCNGCGSLVGGTLVPIIVLSLSFLLFGVVRILSKKRR